MQICVLNICILSFLQQLLNRVTQLEKHVTNLKNVIAKAEPEYQNKKYLRKLSKHARKFDLNRFVPEMYSAKINCLGKYNCKIRY